MAPFLFFFCITFFLMFIQDRTPFSEQYTEWKGDFLKTMVAPIAIYTLFKYDNSIVDYVKWGVVVAFLIAGIYALLLTRLPAGINPYLMIAAAANNADYDMSYSDDVGRVVQRIFSTFSHPLMWNYFICLFLLTFWNFRNKVPSIVYFALICLACFDLVFSGVRTGIAALLFIVCYIIWKKKKIKYFFYAIILFLLSLTVIRTNSDLYDYFYSIVDNSKTDNKGSDLDMRLSQWEGCVDECRGREMVGNGYRFTSYYEANYGPHPKAYTFESLIFVIYTNWGVFGFFIWGAFFFMIYKNHHKRFKQRIHMIYLDAMLLLYIVFSTLTGEYHFMSWFALFYSIIYITFESIENENKLLRKL